MARAVAVVVALAVLLVLVLVGSAWLLQRRLIYFPADAPVPPVDAVIPGATEVTLHTSDALDLGAWYVPPARPSTGMTVLVANGNAGDRAGRAPLAQSLSARGFAVLLFDYRGYGGNPGSPSEAALARDARAAYEHLVTERGVPPDRLIYLGESLGAAVLTELASELPPAALVLRSPFVSLAAVGEEHYSLLPVDLLLRDKFPVADLIGSVDVPVAVVYGALDTVVPPEQSRRVAASARDLRRLVAVPGADHNDAALVHGEAVVEAVVRLADEVAGS